MAKHPQFPNELNLGKKSSSDGSPNGAAEPKEPSTYYPSLYLNDIPGVEKMPSEGHMLVHYKRRSLTIRKEDNTGKGKNEKACASAELECHKLCLPDQEDDEEKSDGEDKGDIIDSLAEKAGIDTGRSKSKAKKDDGEEES